MRAFGDTRTLGWILLVAFVLRVGFCVWWQARLPEGTRFFFADSESYWELGQTIAAGEPYQFRSEERKVFRTPGYPMMLAPLFLAFGPDGSLLGGRILGAMYGTVSVAAVWWFASQIWNRQAAMVAAALAAGYPEAIATSGFLLSETPFCLAMLVQLGLWLRSDQANSWQSAAGWAIASGGVAGCASLIRPSWLLFIPFAGTILLVLGENRVRRAAQIGLICTGLALVMSPWWIRNAMVSGHFVPTTLQVGASLYDGLNPKADGSSNMEPVAEFEKKFRLETVNQGRGGSFENEGGPDPKHDPNQGKGFGQDRSGNPNHEYMLDKALFASAAAWARQNPGQAAHLAVVKLTRLWNIWPNEPSMRSWPVRLVLVGSFVPILVLAASAAWRFRHAGWPVGICLLPGMYQTVLHVVFVSSIRYRQPAMLALMVLAAGMLVKDGCFSHERRLKLSSRS